MGTYDLFRKIAKSDLSEKERTIEQIKYDIDLEFQDSPSYESVLIDGTSQDVQIVTDKKDNKKILSKPDESFSVGQIVEWDNKQFIIIDIDEDQKIQTKGIMQLCNNTLKLLKNQILKEIPCVISKTIKTWGTEETKFFQLPNNQIYCTIPNNIDTQDIELNQVYSFGRQSYKIVSVDDITQKNLLILTMEFTTEEQPEIPEPEIPTKDIVITINGSNTIQKSKSATYVVEITQDGEVVEGENVLFTLENVDGSSNVYATITSQDGVSCVVKAENTVGRYVKIVAMLLSNDEVVGEKVVQIVGLF